ncbi:DNA polymerase III, delta subunit [Legionella steigerwaltii]|uniref:DNA polymerase III subunit delta n=1 Tax=Legionella steigerwaltii TaxID=460 RepID=A0A378LAG1_9GAMM|nr:DNA polymerase III subunit delta [Legionella steigerwaltii]KTD81002.1 DNA polymerase III, delta subunit [Legionella steigerwaltii]STY23310.1 DNA polymerase III, delta subunit [Legionella steigerwaltii]
MQIKQQMLAQQVQKKIAPLYMIIGQDNYLLEDSLITIKSAIKKNHNYDEKIISIQSVEDWNTVREEANSYSLFSETVFLNVFYEKKSIDATGKKILTEYLNSINSRCFIVIRAPHVPAKQLQWLSSHEHAVLTVAYPLNSDAIKSWIAIQLKKNSMSYDPQVPDLIHQYTQGNMLACSQVIEKIALSCTPDCKVDTQQVLEHLSDQCDHDLFELVDACLLGQGDKAIQILRHAANNKTEATLVLWMISQEIRLIMQLSYLLGQNIDAQTACNQLKIWPNRINLYKICCNRLNKTMLQQLHRYCYFIDERIKSNLNTQVWSSLENAALSLCLGNLIGDTCTV